MSHLEDTTGLVSSPGPTVPSLPNEISRIPPLHRRIVGGIVKETGDLLIFAASLFFDEHRRSYLKADKEGRGKGHKIFVHGLNIGLRLGTSAVAYSVALLLGHGLLTSRHHNPASSLFMFIMGLSGGAATEVLETTLFDFIKPHAKAVQKVVDWFWSMRFLGPPLSFAGYSAMIGTIRGATFGVIASLIGLGLPQRKGHYDVVSTLFRHIIGSSILGCVVLHIFFIIAFIVSFYISFLLDPNIHSRP